MQTTPHAAATPLAAPHTLSAEQVAAALEVAPDRGLASDEAERRLARSGPNTLELAPPPGFAILLLRQFKSLLIVILVIAAGISLVVGDPQDAAVIIIVVLLNAFIGAYQEARAEQALAALRQMSAPTARVLRDGEERQTEARDLTPGDVVLVRAGDIVPADGRLLASVSLQADESALTGESLPDEKDAGIVLPAATALADRGNLLFQGTAVTLGHGRMVVTATGSATEMGKLARSVAETGPQATPLERQVAWLGRVLSLLALGACAAVFGLGLLHDRSLSEMFLVAISLAVAAVPEGLPAVVTIVLAIGVQRMARRNAIVRRLAAVEALGAATVICTDKTGTLTLGEMRVVTVIAAGQRHDLDGPILDDVNGASGEQPVWPRIVRAAALCNNARLEPQPVGDPTERALLQFVRSAGLDRDAEEARWPRVGEVPFSSDRKRMTTVHQHGGQVLAITKGAPDYILARCSAVTTAQGDRRLLPDERAALLQQVEGLARDGLRTLALAEHPLADAPAHPENGAETAETIESGLTLLGILGLLDPPRPEVPGAVAAAQSAGIRIIMITGDHPATATAIAGQLGIGGATIAGAELATMTGNDVEEAVETAGVFARVAPQQKVDIVRALQRGGAIAAMTGDGANDAPALRLADIGVAMGVRGTAVAKEAAAIVLADDNFATIVAAVEEGRTIYANLQKVVLYLLAGNLGELLVIFVAMAAGLPLPLQPVQILWINLLTDSLPALGLGMEPREPGTLDRPPRAPGEPFLPGWTVPLVAIPSALLALVTLTAFAAALWRTSGNLAAAQSAAFTTLVLAHLGIALALRSTSRPAAVLSWRANPVLLAALVTGVGLVLLLLYTGPGQALFHTQPLDTIAWLLALALAPLPFLGIEIVKAVRKNGTAR